MKRFVPVSESVSPAAPMAALADVIRYFNECDDMDMRKIVKDTLALMIYPPLAAPDA